MTDLLNKASEVAAKLSKEQQDAIARDILDRIATDTRWDSLFADPRSEALLQRLSDEALEDSARGAVFDFDPATKP